MTRIVDITGQTEPITREQLIALDDGTGQRIDLHLTFDQIQEATAILNAEPPREEWLATRTPEQRAAYDQAVQNHVRFIPK